MIVTFNSLLDLSKKFLQEIDVTIVASKSGDNLHRYKEDMEMYETCEIVIEMIDGGFWEIFSENLKWIDQLEKKFRNVESLRSDFQL